MTIDTVTDIRAAAIACWTIECLGDNARTNRVSHFYGWDADLAVETYTENPGDGSQGKIPDDVWEAIQDEAAMAEARSRVAVYLDRQAKIDDIDVPNIDLTQVFINLCGLDLPGEQQLSSAIRYAMDLAESEGRKVVVGRYPHREWHFFEVGDPEVLELEVSVTVDESGVCDKEEITTFAKYS